MDNTATDRRFYVYAYLRADGTPYYIGKGTGTRIDDRHTVKMPLPERRVMLFVGLTDEEAINREIALIALLGRKDKGTGILRNLTDGGEGTSGRVHSEETRAKMSAASKGQKQSPEHVAKRVAARKGETVSTETRAKISAAQVGRKLPDSTRAKMSNSHRGKVKTAEHLAALAESSVRNTAAKHGVELKVWKLLTPRQRGNCVYRSKSLGVTVSEYIERLNWVKAA